MDAKTERRLRAILEPILAEHSLRMMAEGAAMGVVMTLAVIFLFRGAWTIL